MSESANWTIKILNGGTATQTSSPTEITLSCHWDIRPPKTKIEFSTPSGARHPIPHEFPVAPGYLTLGPFPAPQIEQLRHFQFKCCQATGPNRILGWDVEIKDAQDGQGSFYLAGDFTKVQ
jgi:hypothetical protein